MIKWFRSLFLNPPKALIGIAIFVLILIAALSTKCHAAEPELTLEIGSTITRYEAPVLGVVINYPDAGPVDAGYLIGLHLIGASGELRNQGALTLMLVDGFGNFDIGIGVCLLHHKDARNGSIANFALSVGYRFGGSGSRNGLRERHCSNAGMTDVNKGLDFLTYGRTIR